VHRLKDQRVLIVGEHCGEVARAYGLTKAEGTREYGKRHPTLFPRRREHDAVLTDDADDPVKAILVFEDSEDLGEALQLCLDVLLTNGNPSGPRVLVENEEVNQEVEVWFTNPDIVYSGLATHPRLTQGSYRLCLEALYQSATSSTTTTSYYSSKNASSSKATINNSGRTLHAKTVGKPTPLTGKTALSKILSQCPPNTKEEDLEIWTVGDNPFSDIALAHTMGWSSALVRTGIWKGDDVDDLKKEGIEPTMVADCFASVVKGVLPE
jgi:ribonucleotide monophosphatase NagD (HAD superfamily)